MPAVPGSRFRATSDGSGDDPAEDPAEASGSSPYIFASSPADAMAKFSAMQGPSPQVRPLDVRYGPCTLYPSNIYLRKSSNHGAVGSKPVTKCTTAVTSIHHDTGLHYAWYLWWPSVGPWSGGNTTESWAVLREGDGVLVGVDDP